VKPIVLNIPHASSTIPDHYRYQFHADLYTEQFILTDWLTDELFMVNGAHRIVAPVSRLLVDTERFADDDLEPMVKFGMGCLYTKGPSGRSFRSELSVGERRELLERYYMPHHEALTNAIATSLENHGECLLVDCHSFPDMPMQHESDINPRPDFCLGTTSTNTPDTLVGFFKDRLESSGFSVEIDHPYQGCILPSVFTGDGRIRAIMIEVNRKLYMDQSEYIKGEACRGDRFKEIRDLMTLLIGQCAV
jgi:N-formylglutamate deformylase